VLRCAIVCHRWLGVALFPFVILWFASGIVMMYWGFPEVSQRERFARAPRIEPAAIRVSPESAYRKLRWAGTPESAEIGMLDGRPVYRFRMGNHRGIVFADSGSILGEVTQDIALRLAARWTGQAAKRAQFEGAMREPDQWTVSGELRAMRPLFKCVAGRRTSLRISAERRSGAIHDSRDSIGGVFRRHSTLVVLDAVEKKSQAVVSSGALVIERARVRGIAGIAGWSVDVLAERAIPVSRNAIVHPL